MIRFCFGVDGGDNRGNFAKLTITSVADVVCPGLLDRPAVMTMDAIFISAHNYPIIQIIYI